MELLKTSTMLKALILELQKYDKIEDLQAQVINQFYIYSWVLSMSYYQEGCNISSNTKRSKVLISWSKWELALRESLSSLTNL
jgi:hypothetical protein